MQSAFAFSVSLFNRGTAALHGRLARVQRFAGLSLRNRSERAGPRAAYRRAAWASATRALRKSRWRSAAGPWCAGRMSLACSRRAHSLRSARASLARLKRSGGWTLSHRRRTRRTRGARRCACRSGSSRSRGRRSAGLCRRRARSRWANWRCRSRCRGCGSGCRSRRWSSSRCCGRCCRWAQRNSRWSCCGRSSARSDWRSQRRHARFRGSGRSARCRMRGSRRGRFCRRRSDGCSGTRRLRLGRRLRGFRSGFFLGHLAEMFPNEFGVLDVERARVRLLLGNSNFGQEVDQDFGLDLKLSRQFVDSDLIRV